MFKGKEVEHLNLKHDDMLIISLKIINSLVQRILIDAMSSTDIQNYDTLYKIDMTLKDL